MMSGVMLSNVGAYASPSVIAQLAQVAEGAGWDGAFVNDHIVYSHEPSVPVTDPWVALAVATTMTASVRLGVMVAAVARRRPWVVARQIAALESLAPGRLIIGVGAGSPADDFLPFGEAWEADERLARLEEGVAVIAGLLSGERFSFHGSHYVVDNVRFRPTPTYPVPLWRGCYWPSRSAIRQLGLYQGLFPEGSNGYLSAAEVRLACEQVRRLRLDEPSAFDVVVEGESRSADDVSSLARAGATWYIEYVGWRRYSSPESALTRVASGPPRC